MNRINYRLRSLMETPQPCRIQISSTMLGKDIVESGRSKNKAINDVIIINYQQIFIIKMDFTANKPTRILETETRSNYRKYSINAVSPREHVILYDSPSLDKPATFARTSDKENLTNRGRSDPALQRSPIDPLVASRESAIQGFSLAEVEQMRLEHRAEVEAMMLEITNLRNLLYESSQLQVQELLKLKQGYEDTNFLQMSTFRQNQNSQFEAYEFQIRKLKEQLNEKGEEYKKLEVQLTRERKSNDMQKQTLKEEVRLLIEKKNGEIFELQQQLDHKVRKLQSEKEHEIGQIKYNSNKELNNINKVLENKVRELERLANSSTQGEKQREKLLEKLQTEKEEIQRKYEKRISEQYEKYENLKINFNKLIFETTEIEESNWRQLQDMFNSEYNKIFELVKHKDSEVIELKRQLQLEQNLIKAQKEAAENDCQYLKEKLKEQAQNFQKEIELLKVKISVLHQADLEKVKELYELRLNNALESISRLEEENSKIREMLHISNSQRYELKQRHDITTSQLNAKILKMRMGIHSLQSDFKEKLENEKSLMLMTSRSFLKEAEVKNHNNKFLEEEIRKLRQLMDLQTRENQNAEKAVEEKILAANNELERLSSRVVLIAQEKKELEEALDSLKKEKDKEITRLKAEIAAFEMPEHNNHSELKTIQDLKEERGQRLEEIGILKDKLHSLQSRMKEMKAQIERANMQAQINHEQGKKQYHQIAQSHLSEFKKYYEQKMKRLEQEKDEGKKIISSQYERITDLIKKYKELEQGMKDAVQLMKKRTVLEEKVMNMGMDNNLIKNLSQLLPGYPQR